MTHHLGTLGPGPWAARPAEGGHSVGPEALVLPIWSGLQGPSSFPWGQGAQQAAARTLSHLHELYPTCTLRGLQNSFF